MRGSFFGMNVAMSGIFASQRNLDTIAHNNANVDTDGYTRQVVSQTASSAIRLYNSTGMVGTGSEVVSVARVRDIYLDQKIRYQSAISGEWEQKHDIVDQVQTRLAGTQTVAGYNDVTNEFYTALETLSVNPSDMSLHTVAKERSLSMTTYFNNLAQSLEKMQEDLNFDVKAMVEKINTIGERIETLNKQIYQIEILNESANDLRDARDLLVDELSGYVDIDYGEHNYGKLPSGADDMRFYIYIGGTQFLQHYNTQGTTVNKLACVARQEKLNEEDNIGLFDIQWTKPAGKAKPVVIAGGELRGLLDTRDGNSGYVQTDRFNMLTEPPSNLKINLNLSIGGTAQPLVEFDLDFDEYVPDVASLSVGGLASWLEDKINTALAARDIAISADNRALVSVTEGGQLSIDLTKLTADGKVFTADGKVVNNVSASINSFTFTAPADLKTALGLTELAAGSTAKTLTSGKNIEHAVTTNGYKGIPYYLRKLNEYVRTYAMAFNEGFVDSDTDDRISVDEVSTGHANGYNITQAEGEPPAGVRFFTVIGNDGAAQSSGDFLMMSELRMPSLYGLEPGTQEYRDNVTAIANAYGKMTAKNFTVSRDIQNDVALIATSAKAGEVEDNSNLLAVIGHRHNEHMFSEGAAEDFMQALTTDAAVDTSQADHMVKSQQIFIDMLLQRRESISGVWQNEEFANMIRQQHVYNASSIMFNTFNSIYETLINRLGLM